jgi:hypothetical protein
MYGYDELLAQGYRAVPGKVHATVLENIQELTALDLPALLKSGVTDFPVRVSRNTLELSKLPVKVVPPGEKNGAIRLGANPSVLLQKGGETHFVIVNGGLFDLRQDTHLIKEAVKNVSSR